jgi:hypothetical protein
MKACGSARRSVVSTMEADTRYEQSIRNDVPRTVKGNLRRQIGTPEEALPSRGVFGGVEGDLFGL